MGCTLWGAVKDAKSAAHIRRALDTMIVILEDEKKFDLETEEFLRSEVGK